MFERIEIFDKRYSELNSRLYEPSVASDPEEYQKIMKEIKSIEELVQTYREYKSAVQSEKESLEILRLSLTRLRRILKGCLNSSKFCSFPRTPTTSET